jgi:DNA repair protein RadA/Sms
MMQATALFSLNFSDYVSTGFSWLDDRLGNKKRGQGLGPGKYYFITGDPNAGKTTLLLQMAERISKKGIPVLFISAELGQISILEYLNRLKITEPKFMISFNADKQTVMQTVEAFARFCQKKDQTGIVLMDSLQGVAPTQTARWLSEFISMNKKYENLANVILGWSKADGEARGGAALLHQFDVHIHIQDAGKGIAGGQKREIDFRKNRQGHTGLPIKAFLTNMGYRVKR